MTDFRPMPSAPTDGTRVLIHTWVWIFRDRAWAKIGSNIVEARFIDGKWEPWTGNDDTRNTLTLDPIEWAERPKTTSIWPYE